MGFWGFGEGDIAKWLVKWPKIGAEAIAGLLVFSLLPWPLFLRPRRELDRPPEPQWRVFFWLGFWILIPAYAFYCHSQPDFMSPLDWLHWAISLLPENLENFLSGRPQAGWAIGLCAVGVAAPGFFFRPTRPVFLRGAQWFISAAVLLLACQLVYQICSTLSVEAMLTNRRWHSIWVPRYLGFVWPAIALGISALLMRLPTRPLRGLAILVVLGINGSFGFGRIFAGTEPPIDKMAKDVYDAQGNTSRTRTYMDIRTRGPGPAQGTIRTYPGNYYLQMNAWSKPMSPSRFDGLYSEFDLRDGFEAPSVAREVARSPRLTHLIVWEEFDQRPSDTSDAVLPLLPGWNIDDEEWYPLRLYWDWEDVSYMRQRDYIKVSGPVDVLRK